MARKGASGELKRGVFFGAGSAVGGLLAVVLLAWLLGAGAEGGGSETELRLMASEGDGSGGGCWL